MDAAKIDYQDVISQYPWLVAKNQKAILSPDIDGLLCGLLMSHYLGWDIVGFYAGRNLVLKDGVSAKDCVFLDMEILRPDIRSIGHHMNVHSFSELPNDFIENTKNCANPNNIRKFDRLHAKLTRKYPFGAVHFLMYVLENDTPGRIKIRPEGLGPLFFGDGVWKVLFKYTTNVLDWFDYLHSGKEADWWTELKSTSVIELIEMMDSFMSELHIIAPKTYGHIDIDTFDPVITSRTLQLLEKETGWQYDQKHWNFDNLKTYKFSKKIYGQNNTGSLGNAKFHEIWSENPLSMAMTGGSTIQYTLETPDKLP